jgi:hypothetical protein
LKRSSSILRTTHRNKPNGIGMMTSKCCVAVAALRTGLRKPVKMSTILFQQGAELIDVAATKACQCHLGLSIVIAWLHRFPMRRRHQRPVSGEPQIASQNHLHANEKSRYDAAQIVKSQTTDSWANDGAVESVGFRFRRSPARL